jgi:pimeloyl-ACP methyl ester carboxylesterase
MSSQMASTTQQTVSLPDGRTIGLAEYGAPGGRPVLFFHGSPDSRLSAAILAGAADRNGVRLIALDRPGMGLSDPEPRRRLVD